MFFKKKSIEKLLTEENKKKLVEAIKKAEMNTSGEIKVHIESTLNGKDPFLRAQEVFQELNMHKTELRNGVLLYIALDDKKFSLFGDKGINEVMPENFWDNEKEELIKYFKNDKIIDGIVYFIEKIGEKFKEFFPHRADDINELSDDISVGK